MVCLPSWVLFRLKVNADTLLQRLLRVRRRMALLQDTCCMCAAPAPPGSGRTILTTHIAYLKKKHSSEEAAAKAQPLMTTLNSITDKETKVVCSCCKEYHNYNGIRREPVLQWGSHRPRAAQTVQPASALQMQRIAAHVRSACQISMSSTVTCNRAQLVVFILGLLEFVLHAMLRY